MKSQFLKPKIKYSRLEAESIRIEVLCLKLALWHKDPREYSFG